MQPDSPGGIPVEALSESPAWFPLEVRNDTFRLLRLAESDYRTASFLDQRLLEAGLPEGRCAAATAAAAAARLTPRAHFIFHIGHVGSTLISRLVGAHEEFFSVREPAVLRQIATDERPGGLGVREWLALLARSWRPDQRTVIKATSFVSEHADSLLGADGQSAAIFMHTRPLAHLRGILGGPNSRIESRVLAPTRLARLSARLGETVIPQPRTEGEAIAMSWLCEITALRQAAARFASRILWVDFDAFLAAPAAELSGVFQALGARPEPALVEALLRGPIMRRYSKAPEHAYDAALRQCVLDAADREHGAEIRRGMDWLAALAGRHPLIDASLDG